MSDGNDGGFLARWSRLKREARTPSDPAPALDPIEPAPPAAEDEEAACDLSSLPSLDSLGADSDYTAFMRAGVPKALRLAALRKAWLSDPAIRDYRTLADYDWDCNAPGYGQLRPTDDAKAMVDALFRHLRPTEDEEVSSPAPDAAPDMADAGPSPEEHDDGDDATAVRPC